MCTKRFLYTNSRSITPVGHGCYGVQMVKEIFFGNDGKPLSGTRRDYSISVVLPIFKLGNGVKRISTLRYSCECILCWKTTDRFGNHLRNLTPSLRLSPDLEACLLLASHSLVRYPQPVGRAEDQSDSKFTSSPKCSALYSAEQTGTVSASPQTWYYCT